jgi:hypothetical protein
MYNDLVKNPGKLVENVSEERVNRRKCKGKNLGERNRIEMSSMF